MSAIIFKNLVAAGVLLLLTGCPRQENARLPERILSLSTAATHILTRLGTPPAAIDEYGRVAAGINPLPVIGKGSAVSRERLTELGIDCAIVWYYQADAEKQFRDSGIRVEKVPQVRLSTYPELMLRLGKLTGKNAEAKILADTFRRELSRNSIPEDRTPRRVYFELYGPGKAAGGESYLGDLLRAAGGESILPRTGLTGMESVVESAPEVIFFIEGFGSAEEIEKRPGLASSPAVKNGRVHPVPRRLTIEGLAPLEAIEYLKQKMR